ncbi:MAG: hypothetical protein H7Y19_08215 [Luteimonas sp.]|nr:hypothetical protein [Luteimonas sp.]
MPVTLFSCRTSELAKGASFTCRGAWRPSVTGTYRVRALAADLAGATHLGSAPFPPERISSPVVVVSTSTVTPPATPAPQVSAGWNAGVAAVGSDRASALVGDTVPAFGTLRNLRSAGTFNVLIAVLRDGSSQPVTSFSCRTPELATSVEYRCNGSFRPVGAGTYRVRARAADLTGTGFAGEVGVPGEQISGAILVGAAGYTPAPSPVPPTPVPPTPVPSSAGLPEKVVAGYWPNWPESPIRIRNIPPAYNTIYLFHAMPVGGSPGTTGALYWNAPGDGRGAATNLVADIQYARTTQGRKIILSVGGAGNGMSFPYRGKSQAFVDSIAALHSRLGGFDGLDWNTYEAEQQPDTAEIIWISLELKRRFPGFIISTPPAPWSQRDMIFCQAMVQAGALDYAAPQYYDGPGLNDPAYVVSNVAQWVGLLGASKVVVGFGLWNATNYMSVAQAESAWNQVRARFPGLRGAYDWTIHTDEAAGWPFANRIAPLVAAP